MSDGPRAAARPLLLNGVAGMLPLGVALLLVPVQLGSLGVEAFGAWSLLVACVGMTASLDLGLAASLFRFFGVNGHRAREASDRLLTTALALLAAALLLVTPVLAWAAPLVASVLHQPAWLVPESVAMFRWLGPLLLLPVAAAALAARLQSAGRFGLLAVAVAAGQGTYAVVVLLDARRGMRLPDLAAGLALGQAVTVAVALAAVAAGVGWRPARGFLTRPERRDVGRFAWQMQVAGVWGFVNLEADALIVAALLPVGSIGAYAVGAGTAAGLRSALATLLPPLLGPVSAAGTDTAAAVRAATTVQRRWVRLAAGPAVAGIPLAAAMAATLSHGSGLAAAPVAAALAAGHAVNLGTGVLSYLTRVIGRPGLEARYGRLSALVNVGVTIALTPWLGLAGVCLGTAAGQVVGSLWFVRVVRTATRSADAAVPFFGAEVPWLATTGAGAVVCVGVLAVLGGGARVAVSLVLYGVVAGAGLATYRGLLGLVSRWRQGHARTLRTPQPS